MTQLLRDQLLTKTGEIFEARDEIASLREHLTRSFGAKEEGISNNAEALNSFTSRYLDLSEKISELGGQYSALMIEHLDLTNRLGEMKKARDEDLDRSALFLGLYFFPLAKFSYRFLRISVDAIASRWNWKLRKNSTQWHSPNRKSRNKC